MENRENKIVKSEKENKNQIKKSERKIESRKSNRNQIRKSERKIEKVKTGLNIIEKIVLIGSALSGLLPSLRNRIKEIIA